jgi:hypothetical protein
MTMPSSRRPCGAGSALVFGVSAILLLAAGCGTKSDRPVPATFPVTGQVLYRDGKPVTAGTIQFRSTGEPPVTANGTLAADGTFSLTTFVDVDPLTGTIPGPHKVTIYPTAEGQHSVPSIAVKDVYTVESKENHFTIHIDRPR